MRGAPATTAGFAARMSFAPPRAPVRRQRAERLRAKRAHIGCSMRTTRGRILGERRRSLGAGEGKPGTAIGWLSAALVPCDGARTSRTGRGRRGERECVNIKAIARSGRTSTRSTRQRSADDRRRGGWPMSVFMSAGRSVLRGQPIFEGRALRLRIPRPLPHIAVSPRIRHPSRRAGRRAEACAPKPEPKRSGDRVDECRRQRASTERADVRRGDAFSAGRRRSHVPS